MSEKNVVEIDDCDCGECDMCMEWEMMWEDMGSLEYHPEVGEGRIDLSQINQLDWLTQADIIKDWIGILTEQYNKVIDPKYIEEDMKTWKPVVIKGDE
jgi:hypothetical protein